MVRRAFSWKWRRASDKKQVVTSDSGSIKSWAHSSGMPISSPLSFRKPRSNGKDQFRLKGNRTHHTVAKCLRRAFPCARNSRCCDLPFQFTFLWLDEDRWEGKDYTVKVLEQDLAGGRIGRTDGNFGPVCPPRLNARATWCATWKALILHCFV